MKNPYFASRPGAKLKNSVSLNESFLHAGQNTGNILFFSAIRRVVNHTIPSESASFDPHVVREIHDGIIIPAANWLNNNSDFGPFAQLLKRTDLPLVAVGLGAQSHDGNIPNLKPGTVDLLRILGERQKLISVRGNFTAEVLDKYGIKNVAVTGCPSLLYHVDRPAFIKKSEGPSMISLNGTRSDTDKALFKGEAFKIGLYLSRLAYELKADYVAQTEFSDMLIASGNALISPEEKHNKLLYLSKIYGTNDSTELELYLKSHIKYFFDVPDWISYSSKVDLTIGTRLHGAIASLLAGKPALLVIHDSRTREMAIQAGIPHVDKEEILKADKFDINSHYSRINQHKFNQLQIQYYNKFYNFFQANDVSHNLRLADSSTKCNVD